MWTLLENKEITLSYTMLCFNITEEGYGTPPTFS